MREGSLGSDTFLGCYARDPSRKERAQDDVGWEFKDTLSLFRGLITRPE